MAPTVLLEEATDLQANHDIEESELMVDANRAVNDNVGSKDKIVEFPEAMESKCKHGDTLMVLEKLTGDTSESPLHMATIIGGIDMVKSTALRQNGARKGPTTNSKSTPKNAMQKRRHRSQKRNWLTKSSVLLAVLMCIANATFACIYVLDDKNVVAQEVGIGDIVMHPYHVLTETFVNMLFTTLAFSSSMAGMVALVLPITKGTSFCLRAVVLFGMTAFFMSYALTMKHKVPKFSVIIASVKISSFWLVWVYVQACNTIVLLIWLIAKLIVCAFGGPKLTPNK